MKYALRNHLKKLLLFTLLLSLCFSTLSCAGREVRQDKEIGNLYRTYVLRGSSRTIDAIHIIPPYQYSYLESQYKKTYEITKSEDIKALLQLIKDVEPSLTAVENDRAYRQENISSYKTPEGVEFSVFCWIDIRVDGEQHFVVQVAKQGVAFSANKTLVCFESGRDLSDVMDEIISIGEAGELIPNEIF